MVGDHLQRPQYVKTVCHKKLCVTVFNKLNVELVWGNKYQVDIEIPETVNDYNFGKVGVDGVDQLISYLAPLIRCRRT